MGVVTNSIIYAAFLTVISGKEFVPVLQWGTSHHSTGESVSALRKLSTNEYLDFVLKKVKVDKPLVLVFVEENISVEDFSWRDVDENGAFPLLSNLTKSSAGKISYVLIYMLLLKFSNTCLFSFRSDFPTFSS